MTAREIVERVEAGATVRIPASYIGTFMSECEVHEINCSVHLSVEGDVCTITAHQEVPRA